MSTTTHTGFSQGGGPGGTSRNLCTCGWTGEWAKPPRSSGSCPELDRQAEQRLATPTDELNRAGGKGINYLGIAKFHASRGRWDSAQVNAEEAAVYFQQAKRAALRVPADA